MRKVIELEPTGNGGKLCFAPLGAGAQIRKPFDVQKIPEVNARRLPIPPIPAQRLRLDLDKGVGEIVEPLHDPSHAGTVEKFVTKHSMRLDPPVREFAGIDVNTWAYWLSNLVAAGALRIVSGELPEFDAETAKREFIINRREKSVPERDIESRDLQTAVTLAGMSTDKRKGTLDALSPAMRAKAERLLS